MNNRYVLIMAGGVGSRFWPLSRNSMPKQFLDILGKGQTLIQQSFNRFKSVCPPENIFIVTNAEYRDLVTEQLGVSPRRVLSEPDRRNTAPCIAYGTFVIRKENPDAVIAVTPADHLIENEEEFQKTILKGFEFAGSTDSLLTLGIVPGKPETGYGYILAYMKDNVAGSGNIKKVTAFTEKPDLRLAKTFVENGNFYWNSGIFIWSASSIINALGKFLPDIYSSFSRGSDLIGTAQEDEFIRGVYRDLQNISIDYGVLEKADNVFMLSADIGWSDLGTWSSLYDHTEPDANENAIVNGTPFIHGSRGNLISIRSGKVALLEGLNDYIVVDTEDALLVIRKTEEQKIKQYLKEIGKEI